jgi:cell division protein FtsB
MPWVRRPGHPKERIYWFIAILAALLVGVLIGYERWGTTAALVDIVERELAAKEKRLQSLEERIGILETQAAKVMRVGPKPDRQANVAKKGNAQELKTQ